MTDFLDGSNALTSEWLVTDERSRNPLPSWLNVDGKPDAFKVAGNVIESFKIEVGKNSFFSLGSKTTRKGVKQAVLAELRKGYGGSDSARVADDIMRIIADSAPSRQEQTEKAFSIDDLMNEELPPLEYIIDGLLPPGLCVLGAPPKTGKSWFCLDLACLISQKVIDGQLWGNMVNGGWVLYGALEDSKRRIKERTGNYLSGKHQNTTSFLEMRTKLPAVDNGLLDELQNWVNEKRKTGIPVRLIIIDTLAKVKPITARGADAYTADYQTCSELQQFAIENNVCVLVVTHKRKSGKYAIDDPFEELQGSTGLTGCADTMMVISGKRNEEQRTLFITGRDIEQQELLISFDKGCKRWVCNGDREQLEKQKAVKEYAENPIVKMLRDVLKESPMWSGTATDIFNECINKGYPLAKSPQEIGYILNGKGDTPGIISSLLERDGIKTTMRNGKPKLFTFSKEQTFI